jgi:hypothetical protein
MKTVLRRGYMPGVHLHHSALLDLCSGPAHNAYWLCRRASIFRAQSAALARAIRVAAASRAVTLAGPPRPAASEVL